MCLINAELKIADQDIVCYKVYLVKGQSFVSPYKRALAPNIGELSKTELGHPTTYFNLVYKGFHSFAKLEDAKNEAYLWNDMHTVVIMKCIIPENSNYYSGVFESSKSYCSECIILKEIINIEKCIF